MEVWVENNGGSVLSYCKLMAHICKCSLYVKHLYMDSLIYSHFWPLRGYYNPIL